MAAVVLSFTYFNTIQAPSFIGLDNYINLFTNDNVFMQKVLPNTIVYAVFEMCIRDRSTTLQRQLRETPGVEAWYMRTSNANLEESDYVKTVSYTHLDVYKRQVR